MPIQSVIILLSVLLGSLLICMEMFMPSFGICGISGIVLVVVSSVLTIFYLPFGIFVALGEAVAILLLCYCCFQYIKKRQLYGRLILDETLNEDEKEIGDISSFIGKEGITKTPLRPQGEVVFNGETVEVFSDGNFIPASRKIKVISVTNQKIIVKEI